MDEFAERHTRELVVRDATGASVPSAGVGTCLSKRLILHFLKKRGHVLMTGCVTEDYILGVDAKRAGFRTAFAAISQTRRHDRDFVATLEYFPKGFKAAVRQKTRWVFGINFEATQKLGWQGDLWDRYFFVRDRKGLLTNFLPPISFALMMLVVFGPLDLDDMPPQWELLFSASLVVNVGALCIRYIVRMVALKQIYGRYNPLGVAVRWPIAVLINGIASFRAWKIYFFDSKFASRPITWAKTQHELPTNFPGAS
jgi:adsorption protein B